MRTGRDIPERFRKPPEIPVRTVRFMELDLRIMTVLYGGGARAGSNDVEDPFRIPSIRGQLRFWWRASIGGKCRSVEDLRKAEANVWGDTDQPSRVRLRILYADRGTERNAVTRTPDGRLQKMQPEYALFPAQQESAAKDKKGTVYIGGRFGLEIAAEDSVLEDVGAAVWAWLTFGGLGGRTRRGAGALYSAPYAYRWDQDAIQRNGASPSWPTLAGGIAVMGSRALPWGPCWEECVALLRDFRQQRYRPRGRSKWPEADAIRVIREQWQKPEHAPGNQPREFPRAAFGLPIVFHFNTRKSPGDPEDNTLNISGEDDKEARMASPIILKPWPISDKEAIPLLVALNTPGLGSRQLILRQEKTRELERPVSAGNRKVLTELIDLAVGTWEGNKIDL